MLYQEREEEMIDLTPRQMENLSEWMNEFAIDQYLDTFERGCEREYFWNGGIEL